MSYNSEDDNHKLEQNIKRFEEMIRENTAYYFDVDDIEEIVEYYYTKRMTSLFSQAILYGIKQHPNSVDLQIKYVQHLINENKHIEALQMLEKVKSIDPNNYFISTLFGIIYNFIGDFRKAENYFQQAIKKATNLNDDDVFYIIARSYEQIAEYEKAVKYYLRTLEIELDDSEVLNNIAYCYEKTQNYEKSIKYYKLFLDQEAFSTEAWYNLGIVLYKDNQLDAAIEAYDYALTIQPDFHLALYNKSLVLINLGKYTRAIESLQEYLELDRYDSHIYYLIAESYLKQEEFLNAKIYYEKSIDVDSNNHEAWYRLSKILYLKQEDKNSLKAIRNALAVKDEIAKYWHQSAVVNLALNNNDKAKKSYQKTLKLDSHLVKVWIGYAEFEFERKHINKAISILKSGYSENSENPEISYYLAAYLYLSNKKTEALQYLEKGIKKDANKITIFNKIYPNNLEIITELLDKYRK